MRILLRFFKAFSNVLLNCKLKILIVADITMQKISFVYQQLIDIHATNQNTQLQYTRNSSRKPIPNRYSRNWLRESNCYK